MAGGEAQLWKEGKEMRRLRAWMRVPLEGWLIKSSLGRRESKASSLLILGPIMSENAFRYKVVVLR